MAHVHGHLPASLPRAGGFEAFSADPLQFLAQARERHGNLFAIHDRGPVFSRAADCTGVVAVFGIEHQRTVLSDLDSFGMPASGAHYLKLSQKLVNLNRGLHSMTASQHAEHKRLLASILIESVDGRARQIWAALEEFAARWTMGRTIRLLHEMRELTLRTSCRLLFGGQYGERSHLALLMATYFQLRREATSPANAAGTVPRRQLLEIGSSLDDALRRHVRECRDRESASDGILATLARLESATGAPLSEDEVVGHSNVLFVSSTEPIAVALTWILLILSQLPRLRDDLRRELGAQARTDAWSATLESARLPLLESVINESLRLLPPNAFMVRIATRTTFLDDVELPERCEIVLCPFLSHRDAECFPRPNEFLPDRWSDALPSRFAYLPFGAGGHSCVGRGLAMDVIKTTLAFLLPRYDLVLAGDQDVDWRVHIIFMPRNDPTFVIHSPTESSSAPAGTLRGPVGKMLGLGRHRA